VGHGKWRDETGIVNKIKPNKETPRGEKHDNGNVYCSSSSIAAEAAAVSTIQEDSRARI